MMRIDPYRFVPPAPLGGPVMYGGGGLLSTASFNYCAVGGGGSWSHSTDNDFHMADLPDAVFVFVMVFRNSTAAEGSPFVYVSPDFTGSIELTNKLFAIEQHGDGYHYHTLIATWRPTADFVGATISLSWGGISPSGPVLCNGFCMYNVDPSSDDFSLGSFAGNSASAQPGLPVPAGGAVVGVAVHDGTDCDIISQNDSATFTMLGGSPRDVALGKLTQPGYRLYATEPDPERVTSSDEVDLLPVVVFAMAGTG